MSSKDEAAKKPGNNDEEQEDDTSDVEIEGMDLEDVDEEEMEEAEKSSNAETASNLEEQQNDVEDELVDQLETEDHDETEAARKEQMELMASEQQKVAAPKGASVQEQLEYLLAQSEVFAHFLAGKTILCTVLPARVCPSLETYYSNLKLSFPFIKS